MLEIDRSQRRKESRGGGRREKRERHENGTGTHRVHEPTADKEQEPSVLHPGPERRGLGDGGWGRHGKGWQRGLSCAASVC